MTYEHQSVLERLRGLRLLPVIAMEDAGHAAGLGRALMTGGLPVVEVTFRTAAAADSLRAMVDAGLTEPGEGGLLLGAGTVITPEQVDAAVTAGAGFVVSPGYSRAVVDRCAEHGILVLPGTATATEVQTALAAGLSAVKFFPAGTSGGAAAIRALSGPFPQMQFVPTGGLGKDDLGEYLSLPPVIAVGGSWMVPADAVAGADFDRIERLVASSVTAAAKARP